MSESLKEIAIVLDKIKQARGDRGLTEVADSIGITKQRLWNYENGLYDPPADILVKLALAYGVRPESFTNASDKFLKKVYSDA